MDENNVRAQDFPDIISSISSSSLSGREIIWIYFKENHGLIMDKYPSGSLLNSLIKSTTELFGSEEKYDEISAFFNNEGSYIKSVAPRAVEQSLENIKIRARWSNRDLEKIKLFLENF